RGCQPGLPAGVLNHERRERSVGRLDRGGTCKGVGKRSKPSPDGHGSRGLLLALRAKKERPRNQNCRPLSSDPWSLSRSRGLEARTVAQSALTPSSTSLGQIIDFHFSELNP